MQIDQERRGWNLLIIGCFLIGGLLLRGWALGWGLPYVGHVDEPALVEVVMRMVRNGDPNPHIFRYPSLFYYQLAAAARLHAWWGIRQGIYGSIQDLPVETYEYTTAPGVYLWLRAVTALLGAATVPALYRLGRAMFGQRTGLLAGLALLVAHYHVRHSHYITTDAPTGLWVTLALLAGWRITRLGGWPAYLLGGLMVGLATGTKYNAVVAALGIALAHVFFWRRAIFGPALLRLVTAGGLALLTFLATTPYALLDWPTFVADLRFNAAHYASASHGNFVGRWNVGGYAAFVWENGLFPPGTLLLLLGLPLLIRRFPQQTALLLSVTIAEFVLLLAQAVHFSHNILSILPLMLLLAAASTVTLADAFAATVAARRANGPVGRPALRHIAQLALGLTLLILPAYRTGALLIYWSRPHTLVLAQETLRQLPHGMRAAVELPAFLVADDPATLPVNRLTDHDLDWYRANGFRYLLANDDLRSSRLQAAYQQLANAATLVLRLPTRDENVQAGPGGAILDLGTRLEQMAFVRHPMRFGNLAILLGYEAQPGPIRPKMTPLEGADARSLKAGQGVQINLYWQALAAMDQDYTLFLHILNQAGDRVAQRDLPPRYRDYPTSHWQPGELVVDQADLDLSGLPPGTYQLEIGLYDPSSGERLPLQPVPDSSIITNTLMTLTITR